MSLTIACSCLLCFILSAGVPRCMLCCCLFIQQRKWKKSLSSCRSRIGDKGQQGNNHGPPYLFWPIFFCIRSMSAVFLPFAIQSFQTRYGLVHKEIFSSHKALLSAHQSNTIIPISLVQKPRLKHGLWNMPSREVVLCVPRIWVPTRNGALLSAMHREGKRSIRIWHLGV